MLANTDALFYAFVILCWAAGPGLSKAVNQNDGDSVVLAISEQVSVPSDPRAFLQALKDDMTIASQILYDISEQQAHFKEVVILVPESWKITDVARISKKYSFNTADVRIIQKLKDGNSLTKHSEKCDEEGSSFIQVPLDFFDGNSAKRTDRGGIIAQEWMKYRFGADAFDSDISTAKKGTNVNPCRPIIIFEKVSLRPKRKIDLQESIAPVFTVTTIGSKADGSLPILHVVFDNAGGSNAQSISGATRNLLQRLQNAAQNFDNETMMSVSTFTGSDSGDGNYLNVLRTPINVVQNNEALITIIQSISASQTTDVTRDPGAVIRDAISFSSQFNSGAGDILYLVSRRYVDGGPIIRELDMIDRLLRSNLTLICVEGTDTNDPNRKYNLDRISRLTEGHYFSNTQTVSWSITNDAASNFLITLARSPIDSVRKVVGRTEYKGVSDVAQTGSFLVTPDLGNNTVITIQSSQKGIVTVALTNIQTGVTATLTTKGGTNWNMINSTLYVDALDLPAGENRGRWTYALTFEPAPDALDTKSDVEILGLSTKNENPLDNLPGVWTLNCNLDFPDQKDTTIYAEVIGSVGVLTGLFVTVNLTNVEDNTSQDVSIKLTEEDQGKGLYSGIFYPPFDGLYDFSAEFTADTSCTGDLCAPRDFLTNAPGRCQIRVQGKDIDITTTDDSTSTSDSTTEERTSPSDTTTEERTSTSDTTTDDLTSTSDTATDEPASPTDTTTDEPASPTDTTTDDLTSTSDTTTDEPAIPTDTTTDEPASPTDTTTDDITSTSDTTTDKPTSPTDTTTDEPTSPTDTTTDDTTSTLDTTTADLTSTSDTTTDEPTNPTDTTTDEPTSPTDTTTDVSTSTSDTITDEPISPTDTTTEESTSPTDTTADDLTSISDTTTDEPTVTPDSTTDEHTSTSDTTKNEPTSTLDTTTEDGSKSTTDDQIGPTSTTDDSNATTRTTDIPNLPNNSTTGDPTGPTITTDDTIGNSKTDESIGSSTNEPTVDSKTTDTGNPTDGQTVNTNDESTYFSKTNEPTDSQTNDPPSISTGETTSNPTEEPTEEPEVPTGSPTVKQTPNAGFIIGLCLGIGFLIAFLLILLYCCLIAEEEEDEERGSSVQAIVSTPPPRNFVQRWRLRLIPPAVLRKPPAVTSSSFSTTSTPYKTMDDDSTSTQAYRRKDTSMYY